MKDQEEKQIVSITIELMRGIKLSGAVKKHFKKEYKRNFLISRHSDDKYATKCWYRCVKTDTKCMAQITSIALIIQEIATSLNLNSMILWAFGNPPMGYYQVASIEWEACSIHCEIYIQHK